MRLRRSHVLLLLSLLLVFEAAHASLWISRNATWNGSNNEPSHVHGAIETLQIYRNHGIEQTANMLRRQYHPPLIFVCGALGMGTGAGTYDALARSLLPFGLLAIIATYLVGAHLAGRTGGLLAACVFAGSPTFYGSIVTFEPTLALTAGVTLAVYGLLVCDGFTRPRGVLMWWFGLCLGLYADRLIAAPFVAIPTAWVLVRGLMGKPQARLRILATVGSALTLLGLANAWYYSAFFQSSSDTLLSLATTGQAPTELVDYWRDYSLLEKLLYYPLVFVEGQFGLVPACVVGVGLWRGAFRRTEGREDILWVCVISGLVMLTLLAKKETLYSVPFLPVLTALSVAALVRWGKVGFISLAVLLSFSTLQRAGLGWDWPALDGIHSTHLTHRLTRGGPIYPDGWFERGYVLARPPQTDFLRLDFIGSQVCDDGPSESDAVLVAAMDGSIESMMIADGITFRCPGLRVLLLSEHSREALDLLRQDGPLPTVAVGGTHTDDLTPDGMTDAAIDHATDPDLHGSLQRALRQHHDRSQRRTLTEQAWLDGHTLPEVELWTQTTNPNDEPASDAPQPQPERADAGSIRG